MAELPAQSRIQSKVAGDETIIVIPRLSTGSRGCLGGSWGAVAVFGFLAVTFATQGMFSRNLVWTFAGLACFLVAAWQIIHLRGLQPNSGQTTIRIGPESLTCESAMGRRNWARSAVSTVGVEEIAGKFELQLRLTVKSNPVVLILGPDREELAWVAQQIRLKWKLPDVAVRQ